MNTIIQKSLILLGVSTLLLVQACNSGGGSGGSSGRDSNRLELGLRDVISKDNGGAENGLGKVPSDLSGYDELTQIVLAPYTSGAIVHAIYITMNSGESSPQDGTSWSDAALGSDLTNRLNNISDASADKIYLLLIASSGDASYDTGDSGLRMQNYVAIVGGWDASGDWGRSGTTVLSGGGTHRVIYNRYTATNPLTNTALLYGVSLEDGSIDNDSGGGIYNEYASPVLTHVTIAKNSASSWGGGIFNSKSSPVLTNVTIAGNSAATGGGIYNLSSSLVWTNVTIADNSADNNGGGLYNFTSSLVLTNVTIAGNSAATGGGIYNHVSSPVLTNVTIANNSAATGGGIYNVASSPVIVNSILWDNSSDSDKGLQIYAVSRGRITLAYSLLQGGVADISSDSSVTLITAGISSVDPKLSDLTTDGGSFAVPVMAIEQDSSADDLGVYVRRDIDPSGDTYTYYYSELGSEWYTDFTSDTDTSSGLTGTSIPTDDLPAYSTNPVATDATGKAREARPDAGAYEYISEGP